MNAHNPLSRASRFAWKRPSLGSPFPCHPLRGKPSSPVGGFFSRPNRKRQSTDSSSNWDRRNLIFRDFLWQKLQEHGTQKLWPIPLPQKAGVMVRPDYHWWVEQGNTYDIDFRMGRHNNHLRLMITLLLTKNINREAPEIPFWAISGHFHIDLHWGKKKLKHFLADGTKDFMFYGEMADFDLGQIKIFPPHLPGKPIIAQKPPFKPKHLENFRWAFKRGILQRFAAFLRYEEPPFTLREKQGPSRGRYLTFYRPDTSISLRQEFTQNLFYCLEEMGNFPWDITREMEDYLRFVRTPPKKE